jgi:hypothetical protein
MKNKEQIHMKTPAQPLAEVFGHLITDHTEKAAFCHFDMTKIRQAALFPGFFDEVEKPKPVKRSGS